MSMANKRKSVAITTNKYKFKKVRKQKEEEEIPMNVHPEKFNRSYPEGVTYKVKDGRMRGRGSRGWALHPTTVKGIYLNKGIPLSVVISSDNKKNYVDSWKDNGQWRNCESVIDHSVELDADDTLIYSGSKKYDSKENRAMDIYMGSRNSVRVICYNNTKRTMHILGYYMFTRRIELAVKDNNEVQKVYIGRKVY